MANLGVWLIMAGGLTVSILPFALIRVLMDSPHRTLTSDEFLSRPYFLLPRCFLPRLNPSTAHHI